mgnify:CR=1 FL=1
MENLKRFVIKKLFNEYNVDLNLQNEVNIFVGENGMGKTTILNCLYSVLSGRIENLIDITFEEIQVYFIDDCKPLILTKKDLLAYMDESEMFGIRRRTSVNVIKNLFSKKELDNLQSIVESGGFKRSSIDYYIYRIADVFGMSASRAYRELKSFIEYEFNGLYNGNTNSIIYFKKEINKRLNSEVLYFPTYRRIEEDMSNLGLDTDNERNKVKRRLIQFGMSDVEETISKVLETIKGAAITSFNETAGILLHQYVNNQKMILTDAKIDIESLNIALNRIGKQIADVDKDKIRELAQNGKLYQNENAYLLNLVHNLIESYNKQSYFDEKIKKFKDVCNGFLEGKSYVYDESNLTLSICKQNSLKTIESKNLSSGEKQIISVFAKLYLDGDKNFIILFDEPELSLSIKWQAHFLPDIMNSKKCTKLIAVTHSPFIFDNEYDELAKDMGTCIDEVEDYEC